MKTNVIKGPNFFLKLNFCIIIFLLLANIIFIKHYIFSGREEVWIAAKFFWFDSELNLPTLYSGLSLLLAAYLSFYCSVIKKKIKKEKTFWVILSIIFFFLTIDETVMIHERLNKSIYFFIFNRFDFNLQISGSWTLLYFLVVILSALFFSSFIKKLPNKIGKLFKVSFFIYVFGAIIIEFIVVQVLKLDQGTYKYFFLSTTEELLEMLGICLFNYATLKYIFKYEDLFIEA